MYGTRTQFHYHQPTPMATAATTQPGLTWNGYAWVAATSFANGSGSRHTSYDSNTASLQQHQHQKTTWQNQQRGQGYQQPSQASSTPQSVGTKVAIPENPVLTFTQYYHAYTAQMKQYQQLLQQERDPKNRLNWQSHVEWAQYYADQSSRAAHYFHQNPQSTQPPFDLPPAPSQPEPQQQQVHTNHSATNGSNQSHIVAKPHASSSSSPLQRTTTTAKSSQSSESSDHDQAPTTLKDYVHRCMMQCKTDADKKTVMEGVQGKISQALQSGTLHSKDWSAVPLVELPGSKLSSGSMNSGEQDGGRRHSDQQDNGRRHSGNQNDRTKDSGKINSGMKDSGKQNNSGKTTRPRTREADHGYYRPSSCTVTPSASAETASESASVNSNSGQQDHGKRAVSRSREEDYGYYGPSSSSLTPIVSEDLPAERSSFNPERSSVGKRQTYESDSSFYGPQESSQGLNCTGNSRNSKKKSKQTSSLCSRESHKSNNISTLDSIQDEQYSYYGPPKIASSEGSESSHCVPRNVSEQQDNVFISKKLSEEEEEEDEFIPMSSDNFHVSKNRTWRSPKAIAKDKASIKKRKGKISGFDQTDKVLSNRAKRFAGAGGLTAPKNTIVENVDRFMGKDYIGGAKVVLDETDYENMTVKGTCSTLEKEYLRLTAPPRPELVRPQHVLEKHLENLVMQRRVSKIASNNGNVNKSNSDANNESIPRIRDYLWFCSQYKAIRQDLTVQRIQNSFTVLVYETHARIALEEEDLNEYNQCQTQLKELYRQFRQRLMLKPHDGDALLATRCQNEFIAYRLIYYVLLTGNTKYDGGSSDLFKIMLSLTADERKDPSIRHALAVRESVTNADYHTFFRKLWKQVPNLGKQLLKQMVPNVRQAALERIVKAYRPACSVEFALREIGWGRVDSDMSIDIVVDDMEGLNGEQLEQGREYLRSCGCILSADGINIETKESVVRESSWGTEQTSSLI